MSSPQKKIAQNLIILWGGRRIGRDSNSVTLPWKRKGVESAGFEDAAAMPLKGPLEMGVQVQGAGTHTDAAIINELANAVTSIPFGLLLDSDATQLKVPGGVVSAVGDNALFLSANNFELQKKIQRGALFDFSATLQASDRNWHGNVLYCGLGQTPLATAGSPFTSTPFNAGALLAAAPPALGYQLACALFVCDPPGIAGTTPTLNVVLESAAAVGFSSPTTRLTFQQVVPTSGGAQVLANPGGQILYLDGDVTPVSDPYWRVKMAVAGTNTPTPVSFTVVALIAVMQKLG